LECFGFESLGLPVIYAISEGAGFIWRDGKIAGRRGKSVSGGAVALFGLGSGVSLALV